MMDTASILIAELCDITSDWAPHDKNMLTTKDRQRIADIGLTLYRIGGESLMQFAYYQATSVNRAASFVAALWDGIGGWRW